VLPDELNLGILIKFLKKGDLSNCNNWRGVTLLSLPSKILSRIISNRIKGYILVDNKLRREQMGFQKGRSCIGQVNTLRIILEQFNEFQSPLYLIFIDFEKAFDSINKNKMWDAIRILGIPEKIIRLIQQLYKNYTCQVKNNGKLSEPIIVESGVKQGCLLVYFIFNGIGYYDDKSNEQEKRYTMGTIRQTGRPRFFRRCLHNGTKF
jgi:hypothetical protein